MITSDFHLDLLFGVAEQILQYNFTSSAVVVPFFLFLRLVEFGVGGRCNVVIHVLVNNRMP
jgi:hypothetical protein